jgi:hypothetical protein
MYLDLMAAQSRLAEHIRTIRTLEDLIQHDPGHAELYRGCLEKLGEGYDL